MSAFTIYEKHPTADAYRVGGFYSPYALVATEKRFTGPELMAEYWKVMSGLYDGHARAARARALTIKRFATQPNFDEVS